MSSTEADSRGGVLLISGVPGAGKTTVSEIVARRLPRAALIHGDTVHNFVVSGLVPPSGPPAAEADRQLRLRDRNMAALAGNFVEAGFVAVIDDVFVFKARLQRFLRFLSARPVYLAMLAPNIDVVRHRDATRPDKTVFHIWSHLDEVMRREMVGVGVWIDSSGMSAEETADEVVSRAWDEGWVGEI